MKALADHKYETDVASNGREACEKLGMARDINSMLNYLLFSSIYLFFCSIYFDIYFVIYFVNYLFI